MRAATRATLEANLALVQRASSLLPGPTGGDSGGSGGPVARV